MVFTHVQIIAHTNFLLSTQATGKSVSPVKTSRSPVLVTTVRPDIVILNSSNVLILDLIVPHYFT